MAQVPKTLRDKLARLRSYQQAGPCIYALRWANGKDQRRAWRECQRDDWLEWLIISLQLGSGIGTMRAAMSKLSLAKREARMRERRNPEPPCTCGDGVSVDKCPVTIWGKQYETVGARAIRRHFPWRWVECRARKLGLL